MQFIKNYWYIPILGMIFITGVIFTKTLNFIQIKKMPKALKLLLKQKDTTNKISPFASLCMSLSATIGTGNIIGVATSISLGGVGSLFWLIIFSVIGLAVKYAEGFLAIKYRKEKNNELLGGPFIYIEEGLGKKYKPLAVIFSVCTILAALIGIGTMTQSNGIVDSVNIIFNKFNINYYIYIFNQKINIISVTCGIILCFITSKIIFKSTTSIAKLCEYIVPFMALIYIGSCLMIITTHLSILPNVLKLIISEAFMPKSMIVGTTCYTFFFQIINGAKKGIFANEAGLGSTPIALSTASQTNPMSQGLISMAGMFITTIICILTGIVVIITDSYTKGLDGINITNDAFVNGLCFNETFSSIILFLCITFFGFTSIIGWCVYGVKALTYLTNKQIIIKIYMYLYLIMVFLGTILKVNLIWNLADIFNALMAIPNLIALLLLRKKIKQETLLGDKNENRKCSN